MLENADLPLLSNAANLSCGNRLAIRNIPNRSRLSSACRLRGGDRDRVLPVLHEESPHDPGIYYASWHRSDYERHHTIGRRRGRGAWDCEPRVHAGDEAPAQASGPARIHAGGVMEISRGLAPPGTAARGDGTPAGVPDVVARDYVRRNRDGRTQSEHSPSQRLGRNGREHRQIVSSEEGEAGQTRVGDQADIP